MGRLKYIWKVLKKAGVHFDADNCYRYSAAVSFYTLFSIAPIIFISIYVASLFASDVDFRQLVSDQISKLVGPSGAEGVSLLLESLNDQHENILGLVIGIAVLLFSATNIFIQIQGAFNEIFKVKPKSDVGIRKILRDRLTSLGLILSLGFVMLISLLLDSVVIALRGWLERIFRSWVIDAVTLGENLVIAVLTFAVLYSLYKFLPDVKIPRKYLFRVALTTTGLLLVGKFGINLYISTSRLSSIGGASASVIILMLWVYYTSYILFFGAELIRAMSTVDERKLRTSHYATRVKLVRMDNDDEQQ